VLCCENSGVEAAGGVQDVECVVVPCGGVIDTLCLTEGLQSYEKVMGIVCPDDACRHFDGNRRACAQTERLQAMLEAAGLKPKSVKIAQASFAMPLVIQEEISAFIKA